MNGVHDRIDDLERRIVLLHDELRELRASVATAPTSPPPLAPVPASPPAVPRTASQSATPPATHPTQPREPRITVPRIELADLLGARALAWAGGVVTVLGVVFFFVLAVDRGWIGPAERVALGALASMLTFAGGVLARYRYGQLYSALAAVGAGIAGGYATLLAAAALYGLVPDLAALAIAAGIAAVGTAVSLAWSSETLASIGLVGAATVPVAAAAADGGLTVLGTAFAGIMLAATAIVAIRRGWDGLLVAGTVAAVPQIAWLVADYGEGAPARVVLLAAGFWLLLLAVALARREALGGDRPDRLDVAYVLGSAVLAASAAHALLAGELAGLDRESVALLAVASSYLVLAACWFRHDRELSALLGAVGLAVGALATASLLGGGTLAAVWAVEAALLAWLAYRIEEPRYGIGAVAYLILASLHTVAFDAPLRELFLATEHEVPVAAAVGLAALVVGRYAPRWSGPDGPKPGNVVDELVAGFVGARRELGGLATALGCTALVYAASLGLLELGVAAGSFAWGEVAVTAAWGLVAAVAVVAARRSEPVLAYGLAWAGAAMYKLVYYDAARLDADQAGISALLLGAAFLAAGSLAASPLAVGLVPLAAAVAGAGALAVADSSVAEGVALLAVATPFAVIAALRFGERARATALWASALALGLVASTLLLEWTALVASWAVAAVALALLAERTTERRLQLAGYVLAALALVYTLSVLAPPEELLVAERSPADGVVALVLAVLAVLGVTRRVWPADDVDDLDRRLAELQGSVRLYVAFGAGVLAVYAGSLTILAASQAAGGDLTTAFQRGHTAVSAFWGAIGLVALYLGLTRASASLRLAGFAVFGVSLAKIFLYDLSRLSSVTRALSFLAVGAVLLLAGFFYQRLTAPSSAEAGNQAA